MFLDESGFLLIPNVRKTWVRKSGLSGARGCSRIPVYWQALSAEHAERMVPAIQTEIHRQDAAEN